MNPSCFLVTRPDGFVGVEVEAGDQLTADETRAFAAELLRAAAKADREAIKFWEKKICDVEYDEEINGYVFKCGRMRRCWTYASSKELEKLLLKHKITHVNSTFGDDKETPESPRKGLYTRAGYLRWWRTMENED